MNQIIRSSAITLLLLVLTGSVIGCPCSGNIDFSDEPPFPNTLPATPLSPVSPAIEAVATPAPEPTPELDPSFAGFIVSYPDPENPEVTHPAGNVTVTITISPTETLTLTTDADGMVDLSGFFEKGTPLSVLFTSQDFSPLPGEYIMPGQPGIISILLT